MRRRDRYAAVALIGAAVLLLGLLLGFGSLASSLGGRPAEWTLEAEPVPADRVTESLTMDLTPCEAAVATRAVENGTAETVGYALPVERASLERNGPYVERDGTYYRLAVEPAGERAVTRHVASFEAVNGTDGEVIAHDSLPDPDQRAVGVAFKTTLVREERDCGTDECPPMEYVYERPSEAEASAIVDGGVEYVRYQDTTFRVTATERAVEERAYRYTAEPVASSESTFRRAVVRDVSPSGEAGGLLEAAIEDGSVTVTSREQDGARVEALDRVLTTAGLPERSEVQWGASASTTVRYEGSYYRLRLTGEGGGP
jgi:hypothetical protein